MPITFHFDLDKALEAMAYIVRCLNRVEKVKLMKLLYIADRESFLKNGYPITGDILCAMPWGPVPSESLNAVDGELWPAERNDRVLAVLRVEDNVVTLKSTPSTSLLEHTEISVLDDVLKEHGATPPWRLVDQTHAYPEYREVYVERSSRPIPFEIILKHYGTENQYRHNRPVVSERMAAHMVSPFRRDDADL